MTSASLKELFSNTLADTLDPKIIQETFKKCKGTDELKKLVLQNTDRAIDLSQRGDVFVSLLTISKEKEDFVRILESLKQKVKISKEEETVDFCADALSLLVTIHKFPLKDVEIVLDITSPNAVKSKKCWSAFTRFYKRYESEVIDLVEQQLDILNVNENYGCVFKIVGTVFDIKRTEGKKLFLLDSVQESLRKVNQYSSAVTIREGLSLLSTLCSDDELRKEIATQFLPILVDGVKSNDVETQVLSSLVIIKTWNFSQVELEKSLSIDELYNTITKKFTKYTIEGLAYLSIKPAVKSKLRNDDEVIFDITKVLDPKNESSPEDFFGSLVVLANLTTIEEESEVSELKKHAQKGLEEELREDLGEILDFQEDLLERNVLHHIASKKTLTFNSVSQAIKLVYNLAAQKQNRPQVLSQSGLEILLRAVALDNIPLETKDLAYKGISNLLLTTNPTTIFQLRQAQFALFQFLSEESVSQKDQLNALISLTNANAVDNGALTESQWAIIDHFLNHENTIIRRSAIELVCNLAQHKDNVAPIFNFQSSSSKKRYELLVQYTLLEDVKSQCSAVAALSFGVTVPFISQEVIKDETLLDHLKSILIEQYSQEELLERVLFVLYHLIFNSEDNSKIMSSLATDSRLKQGIENALRSAKKQSEPFEMALEISKMVKFK